MVHLDRTTPIAEHLAEYIRTIPGTRDVQVKRDPFKQEYNIEFDREKLAIHGLNTATAATYVRNRMNGLVASKFREGGKEYNIRVRYAKAHRTSLADVENITLYTPSGAPFKLKEVARITEFYAPPYITRENRQRSITVSTGMPNASMSKIVDAIWDEVRRMDLHWRYGQRAARVAARYGLAPAACPHACLYRDGFAVRVFQVPVHYHALAPLRL